MTHSLAHGGRAGDQQLQCVEKRGRRKEATNIVDNELHGDETSPVIGVDRVALVYVNPPCPQNTNTLPDGISSGDLRVDLPL